MKRTQYTAMVLRYVHDMVSGEFVNVGIVLACPSRGFYKFGVLPRTKRVVDFFPGARALVVRTALTNARRASETVSRHVTEVMGSAADPRGALTELAHRIVARDDSALQWSDAFSGLTNDPAVTFERLMERLVLQYEEKSPHSKRTDGEVWRTFSKVLESRRLAGRLQEHEIQAKVEPVKFQHALKNGKWHVMEPVSFDLASSDSITDKAKKLLGEMSLLKTTGSDFKLYFLVGQPSSAEVYEGYEKALKILEEIPCDKAIYPEARADEFASELARVAAH